MLAQLLYSFITVSENERRSQPHKPHRRLLMRKPLNGRLFSFLRVLVLSPETTAATNQLTSSTFFYLIFGKLCAGHVFAVRFLLARRH